MSVRNDSSKLADKVWQDHVDKFAAEQRASIAAAAVSIDARLVRLQQRLDIRWFHTRLRAKTPDRNRQDIKDKRIARGLRLAVYWYHAWRRRHG
jgi:hypothetical protein